MELASEDCESLGQFLRYTKLILFSDGILG